MPQRWARLRRLYSTGKEKCFDRIYTVNSVAYLYGMHQGGAHGGGGLPTVRRVFGESALDYLSDLFRNFGGAPAQWNYFAFKYGLDGPGDIVVGTQIQCRITGQQAVSRHSNR